MITILTTLERTQGTFDSNTIGFLNPCWIRFRQHTGTFSAISNLGGGLIRVTHGGGTFLIGDRIRLSGSVYQAVGTIVAVGSGTIDLSGIDFISTDAGYLTNLSQFKTLQVQTRLVTYSGVPISKAVSSWFAGTDTLGLIDLESELRSLFYDRQKTNYSLVLNTYQSGKFKVQFREVYWNASNQKVIAGWQTIDKSVTAIPARKQIQEQFGNNLVEYVFKPAGSGMKQFINPGFDSSLVPWLQDGSVSPWAWSFGSALSTITPNTETNVLYQLVDVAAGSHSITVTANYAGTAATSLEVWAFNSLPALSGTLVGTIPLTTTPTTHTVVFTFPAAQFVGFRAVTGSAPLIRVFVDDFYFTNVLPSFIPGRFLTRFNNPPIWRGIKRPASFVLDINSSISGLSIRENYLDVNGSVIGTNVVNHGALSNGLYSHTINPPVNASAIALYGFVTGSSPEALVSEVTTFKIKDLCTPYILLEWQNSLGGFEQWAFVRRHQITINAQGNADTYEIYDYDIENSNGNLFREGIDQQIEISMGDEFVRPSEAYWLDELKKSRQVRMLLPNNKFVFVVVTSALETSLSTKSGYVDFQVTIRLPKNFNPVLLDPQLNPFFIP